MKNKIIYKLLLAVSLTFVLSACNDDFMERFPEDKITDKKIFKDVKDLELYTNGFYGYISAFSGAEANDDVLNNNGHGIYKLLRDEIDPKTQDKWGWGSIRNVNFFMGHYHKAVGDKALINNQVGIARLNRAWLYYSKVRSYSDVPWYSRTLQTGDTELLYKKQDPRSLVVDSIMADLDFASKNIIETKSRTKFNKWAALAIQATIALEEASWRKYHPELKLTDADKFYAIARDAADAILSEGGFKLNTTSSGNMTGYQANFRSISLSGNPEMIMYVNYEKALSRKHNMQAALNNYYGLSRSLMEDYLVIKDGKAVPFHTIKDYNKTGSLDIFKDRDPRLSYTFMPPGFTRAGSGNPSIPKLGLGGYIPIKWEPNTADQLTWNESYTDLPLFRLAEVMLIYAEAKAELGELTENDLEKTIHKLRDRVGMPRTSLAEMLANIDPVQAKYYPNVSGPQKGAILEIRRERRVELAYEGFRSNDIFRWGVAQLLVNPFEGIYIEKLGYIDLTGDSKPDIVIVKTKAEADEIGKEIEATGDKIVIYSLEGNTFYLSEGDKGYIRIVAHKDAFKFIEPKYYYSPIAERDIVLNENLYQNEFWK